MDNDAQRLYAVLRARDAAGGNAGLPATRAVRVPDALQQRIVEELLSPTSVVINAPRRAGKSTALALAVILRSLRAGGNTDQAILTVGLRASILLAERVRVVMRACGAQVDPAEIEGVVRFRAAQAPCRLTVLPATLARGVGGDVIYCDEALLPVDGDVGVPVIHVGTGLPARPDARTVDVSGVARDN
jgi:hypothetical protein